jgi:DNA-binding transcriptional MerR regulator
LRQSYSGSGPPDWLLTGEVAAMFGVTAQAIRHWDGQGRFPRGTVIRTLGGHRRFRRLVVEQMAEGSEE